jgi:CHAT domain-containing protein
MLASQAVMGGRAASIANTDALLQDLSRAEGRLRDPSLFMGMADVRGRLRQVEEVQGSIHRQAPQLATLVTVAPPDLLAIQERLDEDDMVLEYYRADDLWMAFVLTRSGIQDISLGTRDLTGLVSRLRQEIQRRGDSDPIQNPDHPARQLYDILIKPVQQRQRLSRNLMIVPHGPLHYLPFSILRSPESYLVEEHALTILPSADVLRFLERVEISSGPTLALGNPDRAGVSSLPSAEIEAGVVAGVRRHSTLFVRKEATRENLLRNAPAQEVLHIAAHGQFVPEAPRQTRLLLATSAHDTGDLTVADLFALQPPLSSSLAVLSACETAVGGIAAGDEVIGFQRGLLFSGVDSMIGSLWSIDDDATGYLMENLYGLLNRGVKVPEALRRAQMTTMARYPHPFYWGAFTFTGFTS